MHYKDGTEAKIGDLIKGIPYNNGGKTIVGELIQATPGTKSCNCVVAFAKTEVLPAMPEQIKRSQVIFNRQPGGLCEGNASSEILSLIVETDYGQLDAFELVHRPQ